MRSKILRLTIAAALLLPATNVLAASSQAQNQDNRGFFERLADALLGPTVTTGQPGEECGEEDAATRPGNSETGPGSAFNPDGTSGEHYAGEQPQNSKNTASVSQYDVACAKVSQNTTQP